MNKDKMDLFDFIDRMNRMENIIQMLDEGDKILKNLKKEDLKDPVKRVEILSKLGDILKSFYSFFSGIGPYIKLAYNYQELEKDEYTFQEMVKWFKENKPEGKFMGAVLKSKANTKKGEMIILYHTFIDEETKEPCMLDCQYRVVKTFRLDAELKDLFGNKDLLLLK